MSDSPSRVVQGNMIGLAMPDIDVWSERVITVLGQNPGPFTGPGTNTYLVGRSKKPILLDTGQGLPQYLPLLERALDEHRGTAELEQRVDSGAAAVAFAMYPVTVDDLFAVSDAGQVMPPKSTWFEPKLRDGLLIHEI